MEELGQLNLLMDMFSDKMNGGGRTPCEVGNSLFRNLLEKSTSSQGQGGWSLSPYEEASSASGERENTRSARGSLERLDSQVRQLGLPAGQLRLPRSALPQLVSLLEARGMEREEIHSLIGSVSEKDGSIRLDRLMARLKGAGSGRENTVIPSGEIPRLGEALLALGLGVGSTSEVIEKSLNQKGEVSLDKLRGSLSAQLPSSQVDSLLPSLLERFQIKGMTKAGQKGWADADVKAAMKDFSETTSQEMQKRIKEEMARLLREKGVPPQEVKSFLETLSVGYARSLAKKVDPAHSAAEKAAAEGDAKALMDKVVLQSDRARATEGWREKMMEAFQGEKWGGKETLAKNWFQDEGVSKLAQGEQGKPAEQKARSVPAEAVRIMEARQKPDGEAGRLHAGTAPRKAGGESKPIFSVRESVVGDGGAVSIQREHPESAAVTQAKRVVQLPEPLPKVLDRMAWMIQTGEQKGRILISPPELGRLDLDVVIKQGHLQAQLSAENPQVKEIIEANLSQLKHHLSDLGFVVDRFDVMVGLEERSFSREEMWASAHRKGRSSRKERADRALPAAEAEAPMRSGSLSSQVDMIV
ncbi:MAG: flagellar hook-length control protein FliK [Deltaproteobacteria bacterium]|nr:flagellar hook-length control protein FliK [Deltaproteobacteria bacterium]